MCWSTSLRWLFLQLKRHKKVQWFFSKLHRHETISMLPPVSQAEPATESIGGKVEQGLGWLSFTWSSQVQTVADRYIGQSSRSLNPHHLAFYLCNLCTVDEKACSTFNYRMPRVLSNRVPVRNGVLCGLLWRLCTSLPELFFSSLTTRLYSPGQCPARRSPPALSKRNLHQTRNILMNVYLQISSHWSHRINKIQLAYTHLPCV